jgi:hypothetical protein
MSDVKGESKSAAKPGLSNGVTNEMLLASGSERPAFLQSLHKLSAVPEASAEAYLHSVIDELCGRDPTVAPAPKLSAALGAANALELSALSATYQQFFTFVVGQKLTKEQARSLTPRPAQRSAVLAVVLTEQINAVCRVCVCCVLRCSDLWRAKGLVASRQVAGRSVGSDQREADGDRGAPQKSVGAPVARPSPRF